MTDKNPSKTEADGANTIDIIEGDDEPKTAVDNVEYIAIAIDKVGNAIEHKTIAHKKHTAIHLNGDGGLHEKEPKHGEATMTFINETPKDIPCKIGYTSGGSPRNISQYTR